MPARARGTPCLAWKQKQLRITPRLLDTKKDKQDDTGFVPGGLITWLVWEVVPGIRLSDPCGAAAFWALDISERDAIREAFKESIMFAIPFPDLSHSF